MGESKRRKSKADQAAAEFTRGIPVQSMFEFMDSMLEHCHRNEEAMEGMDAAAQAKFMRDLFDNSHIVLGMWENGDGYEAAIMKSEFDMAAAERLASAMTGNGVAMVTAFFVADEDEAEGLQMIYPLLGRGVGGAAVNAEGIWEAMTPVMREERLAQVRRLEAAFDARTRAA